ncbi:hypothetical protein SCTVLC_0371 [Serratia symbiotica SCt-VLC]|uniref:Uncharacterized protein n=1 Tax=Serratia symbiotica SCt-VLC TaxID=1347341 RepID=A0A068RA59_9GAMM|nr:hypothetical protein SCTVLC_0371 [Serratia symbiotica SCt-VLC]
MASPERKTPCQRIAHRVGVTIFSPVEPLPGFTTDDILD